MGFSPFGGGIMFSIVPVIVALGFILVFGLIVFKLIQGGSEWIKNNNSPVLTVVAKVVAKRMAVSRHNHHTHHHNPHHPGHATHHTSSSTIYFVTFEVESGDRIELKVPDKEYGMLAEGDMGRLTFQGTRYKGFERNNVISVQPNLGDTPQTPS